jgi:hypothetical protein
MEQLVCNVYSKAMLTGHNSLCKAGECVTLCEHILMELQASLQEYAHSKYKGNHFFSKTPVKILLDSRDSYGVEIISLPDIVLCHNVIRLLNFLHREGR